MVIDRSIVAAIAAAVLFGISTPLAKLLVGLTEPLMLSGLLYCGSGIGLAAVIASRAALRPRGNISIPRGGDWWWLGGAIATGGIAGPYLLIKGLAATDAASASLVREVHRGSPPRHPGLPRTICTSRIRRSTKPPCEDAR